MVEGRSAKTRWNRRRGPVAAGLVAVLAVCLSAPARAGEPAPSNRAGPAAPGAALPQVVADTPVRIELFPPRFRLDGQRRRMQLIVSGHYGDGQVQDLTRVAEFSTSNPQVVEVVQGVARPTGDGVARMTVRVGELHAEAEVEVSRQGLPEPVSLHYEAMATLTRQGCNAGACHGSPTGKGGFRLSLRAFDPELDALTLIREAFGRRVNPSHPGQSLLLLKPTMQIAHGGGRRLRTADPGYEVLRTWIQEGCRPDPPAAPVCTKLEVYPAERALQFPAHTQQLCALAHFSNGSVRDVTLLADFLSTDEVVATVDAAGLVTGHDRGETAVVVRYLEQIAISSQTMLRDVEGFAWKNPAAFNEIDESLFAKQRRLQIQPAELCTDGEFIRRASLDVLGLLPSVDDVTAFLADRSENKRADLIDRLLARDEYAEFWAMKWGDLLQLKASKVSPAGVHKFHNWIVSSLRRNLPYDQFARGLLTARGSTFDNPPANYFRTATDPNSCSETTSQLFLGIRIQCAKCHNHPYERWTQDNYYGLASFFSRVQRKETAAPDEMVVWVSDSGEVTQPRTGRQMTPLLPMTGEVDVPPGQDRREVLADWLTQPGNPFFAKVGVNRLWAHVMGRGIVEPVDDFRDSNPPADAALLESLADEFARQGFDQKRILRKILNSRTYQLSSRVGDLNRHDSKYFSHYQARLLSAEQLLDAICQVTGVPEKFVGLPAGTRATQLPSPDVGNDFLKVFGQPARNTACECERSDEPKLTQALQLINGTEIVSKLQSPGSRLSRSLNEVDGRLAAAGKPPADRLQLWLRADAGARDASGAEPVDGDRIAAWQDQAGAGAGRQVTQADPTRQPVYVGNALSGLPALRFDGTDDLLQNAAVDLVSAGSARTVLAAGRAAESGSGGTLFTFRRSTPVFTVQEASVSGTFYVYSDGVHAAGNASLPAGDLDVVRKPFVTAHLCNGAGQKLKVHLNGNERPVTQGGAVGLDSGGTGFTVGSREDYPGFGWSGDLYEILVYDRVLTDEELAAAGTYLTTRYGIATSYPARPIPVTAASADADRRIIVELYLAALSRYPGEEEIAGGLEHIVRLQDRRTALEDLYWAVLNSKEFLFQH